MKCIVGLGNPGKKYEKTRHNIGFMVIDALINRFLLTDIKSKFKCTYTIATIHGEKVMLVKPLTFMNLSGEGLRPLLDYYDVATADVLAMYDDLDLPVGKIRLREKGGHGGHNGVRSLLDHLSDKDFKRLRIGIGRPTDETPIVNYVLQSFAKAENKEIELVIEHAADACETWLKTDFSEVMNTYNR